MAPKAKPINIYVVLSSAGIDTVHVNLETAQERVPIAKSEGLTAVKIEVQSLVGALPGAASVAQADDKKATPAKPKADSKPKEPKTKEPKSESKPKDTKPKDPAAAATPKAEAKGKAKDESKAKDTAAQPSASAAPTSSSAPTLAPAPPASSAPAPTGASAPTPVAPKPTPAKAASATKPAATPKAAPKTIPADEQRATNAKKGTKTADDNLPDNVKTLLNANSDTLNGLTVVVTGVPPTIGRKNAEKLVENHGAKLGKSITGKTSLVVLGNDAGPKKLEQIKDLKIETIDEDGLIKKLEAGGSPKKRAAEDDGEKSATKAKKAKK